jgi:2-hydroxy-3-keto-5-methylthiopentenyl-1-phosphate phosphatase
MPYARGVAAIICLDFDDTVVLDNTSRQLFERFAKPEWREREAAYKRGEISVEQFNAAALDLVDAGEDELRIFVEEVARPREGLLELTDWAHWHGWLAVVVSNGFQFYVDAVLDRLGLDRVARHAGRARFLYRWRVTYLSPRGVEIEEGFKLSYAAAFRNAGDFVVYVGDGASDVEAARLAPVVFARDTLWERLKDEHQRIFPFETFHDVVAVLAREGEGWLAAAGSGGPDR